MPTRQDDLRSMLVALFTLFGHFQRAGRKGSGATLGLLRLIAERDGVRPSEAAIELGIHQSTVTRQMQSLEAAGLVTAKTDRNDRRASSLSITPAGRKEITRLSNDGFVQFSSYIESWNQKDIRALGDLLEKLTDTLAQAHRQTRD